jgi:5-oxoprolinase (ATP-hydrolysing)
VRVLSTVTIAAPQLDVNTVAAGGGSKLTFANGAFGVGPDSVGAHPGPVCYRKGGSLAVTDANLQLGRIVPAFFPHIFGKGEDQPLDAEATGAAFRAMADAVNSHQRGLGDAHVMSVDEVAAGFVRVANEAMCRPIRALTNMKGFDPSAHVLACFGGAGGQHCCAIARALGMRTVFVHRLASVLSALGIGLAATVHEEREPAAQQLAPGPAGGAVFDTRFAALEQTAAGALRGQGFAQESISCERYLNLRYQGTDVAIMTPCPAAQEDASVAPGDYAAAFVARYKREFGFSLDRPLIVDDLRVRATAAGANSPDESADAAGAAAPTDLPPPSAWTSSFFEGTGRSRTPVYTLSALPRGSVVAGPALLVDDISTVVVEPGCSAHITGDGNIRIDVASLDAQGGASPDASEDAPPDPVQLSVFGHRFMGIAEQMGRTLQRTSVSVNIKERLDFSCALFGPDGGLVANAPHLPVHLGAMQEAVRFQLQHHAQPGVPPLVDGDVLVSNHPQLAGGSHLPDITVITPVFDTTPGGGGQLVFFVASRGHHADIGGISPGSMPPNSTSLAQEGAAIVSFKLVRQGLFQEQGISELLQAPASSGVPGCCGTRNLSDNLSDLRAQVAANQRGIALVRELIAEHSLRTVQAYMTHIRRAAERAVRAMLVRFSLAQGLPEVGTVRAVDYLDDGTPIALAVTIDRATGSAVFDFSGTGPEVHGNLNAPPAVTYSAVIYALRCMVREDIPLNQGCLTPITLTIPDGSVLRPSATAAVVGGNVLTSQRVTDVVLRAFDAAAASQGCMNNLTFGDAALGYYETICGGAGAGPGFSGRSGVHTHMTNTRITDPEILERRYPVVLRAFRLRPHSGGAGTWSGGDGVVRELEVLRPLTVGILSERRALPPFGLHGGGDGQRGANLWLQAQLPPGGSIPPDVAAREVSLGGKATVVMQPGDRLRVLTPGGGGYGVPGEQQHTRAPPANTHSLGGGSLDAFRRAQESV